MRPQVSYREAKGKGMTIEWHFTANIYVWALPLALGAQACDFNHAICINIDFMCFHLTAMITKE